MANLPKHVTTKELAESLNCSQRTVRRMAAAGEIPAVKVRSEYRFNVNAVSVALSRAPGNGKK